MRVSAVTPGKMKLRVGQDRDWFSVDGTVALDEDQVLEMRFLLERLDRSQGRFVPLGDGRFVALTRQLQDAIAASGGGVGAASSSGRRVHALGAPALDAVLDDAGEVKADAAWKKHVARIRAAEGWTPALPADLAGGTARLPGGGVRLAVPPRALGRGGLPRRRHGARQDGAGDRGDAGPRGGGAVPGGRAHLGLSELGSGDRPVRPDIDARTGWPAARDRAELIAGLGARDVLVCSYGLLHQAAELWRAGAWQMVVLDEAQAIKNAETKRAQAVQTLQAGFRLALTGTPVENYLDELWSLFSFVNPGRAGIREGFQKRFARPIERDKDPQARQALRALIRPFLLRRTKAAVLSELPPRTEQTMNVEMTEPERAFYEALRQRSLERIAAWTRRRASARSRSWPRSPGCGGRAAIRR